MKITHKWLKEQCACSEGIAWFLEQDKTEAVDVLKALIADDQRDWANWTIVRVMSRPQYLAYAIFAAEQVIDLYEKQNPDDKRPRMAIDAAKAVLRNDTEETRDAAWAAARAARDAARDAARAARDAAWDAAWAAGDNRGAAWAARDAAWSAAWAARDAKDASEKKMMIKILRYGIKLLERNP